MQRMAEAVLTWATGDITQYVADIEALYGNSAIRSNIKILFLLDLIDPMLFASCYTLLSGKAVNVPMIPLGQIKGIGPIGCMPSVRLILTPYGVLEKRINVYIDTAYTPLHLAWGFGQELKSNDPVYSKNNPLRMTTNRAAPAAWYFTQPDTTPAAIHHTYYAICSVDRLCSIQHVDVGFCVAVWRQPEFMTPVPRQPEKRYHGITQLYL